MGAGESDRKNQEIMQKNRMPQAAGKRIWEQYGNYR